MTLQNIKTSIFSLPYPLTVAQLRSMKGRVFLDLSFNRIACWTEKQMKDYIIALVLGKATSKIHIAKVETCIEYCKSIGKDKDAEYFMEVRDKENCMYIALDGNNRTVTLCGFMDDKNDDIMFIASKKDKETLLDIDLRRPSLSEVFEFFIKK